MKRQSLMVLVTFAIWPCARASGFLVEDGRAASSDDRQLAAPQSRPGRHAVLPARSNQPIEREIADAAMALSARRHRRRQQSDDAGRRRRHDVCDRSGSVYAVDAADGHLLWTYDVTNRFGGGAREGYVFRNRGVVYADGVVYTAGGSFLFALDAKTGKPLPGFGKDGQASVILDVLPHDTRT